MKEAPASPADPIAIIARFYAPGSPLFDTLVRHSRRVAKRAVQIAVYVAASRPVDTDFVYEAAMLHDIGICKTDAASLGCTGNKPYVCHGCLGAEMLVQIGLPRHAGVCETHVGAGITKNEILSRNLPLPPRDMLPGSIEEQIICYADKFYSKKKNGLQPCKTVDQVVAGLMAYGREQAGRFLGWHAVFGKRNRPA